MTKAPKSASAQDPFQTKLDEIEDRIADQEKLVEQAKQEYLKDTTNADARVALQAAKQPLMGLSVERGFYLRAISEAQGGTSHMPPA